MTLFLKALAALAFVIPGWANTHPFHHHRHGHRQSVVLVHREVAYRR